MFCHSCQARNKETSQFCTSCGVRIAVPAFQAGRDGLTAGYSTPQIDPYSPEAHAEGAEFMLKTPLYRPPYGVADPFQNSPNSYPVSQGAAYTQSLPVPYRPANLPAGHSIICATCNFPRPSKQESCPNCGRALVNNSGQNGLAPVEVAEGWNWGAFMFPVLWSVAHENWFGLLALVPFLGVIMSFVLGAQGNQLAWQHRRFQSVEHFQEVQRVWRNWSIGAMAVVAALIVMALFGMPG